MKKSNEEVRLAAIKTKLQSQIARLTALHAQSHDGSTSSWMNRLIEEVQIKTLSAVLEELEKG